MNLIAKAFLAASIFAATSVKAQTPVTGFRDFGAFSWEMTQPTDNNFLSESSLSGFRIEYRRMVAPRISAGFGISWNAFDEYFPTKTFTTPDGKGAVTTDRIRQVYTVPFTLTGHYYFGAQNKMIRPYAGVGLGTQFAEMNSYFNIYQISEDHWGFVGRPEVGALVKLGASQAYALISLGYNMSTNKYDAFDISGISQFTLNIGIGLGN